MDSILHWSNYSWAQGPPCRMAVVFSIAPLKILPSLAAIVCKSYLVVGLYVHFNLFLEFYLAWTFSGHIYAVTVTVSSYVHQLLLDLKVLLPWNHLLPLALRIFPLFLPHRFWALREGLWYRHPEYSKVFHSLHNVQLWLAYVNYRLLQDEASLIRA